MHEDEAKPLVRFAVMPPMMGLQRPPLPLPPLPGVQLLLLPLLLFMAEVQLEVVTMLEARIANETALETGGGDSWVREGVEDIIDDMPLSLLHITDEETPTVPPIELLLMADELP